VDVRRKRNVPELMRRYVLLLALFLTHAIAAAERPPVSEYERFLLPVYGTFNGANGARWTTSLWLRNEGDAPVDAFPLSPTCVSSFLCFAMMRPYPAFEPRMTGYHGLPFIGPFRAGTPSATGQFLYVERARAHQLSVQLHIRDASRSRSLSTRLPVVRESEFLTGTQNILGVPVSILSRISLRIYELDSRPSSEFLVRFWDVLPVETHGPVIWSEIRFFGEVRMKTSYEGGEQCGFLYGCPAVPYRPGFGEIPSLLGAVPSLYDAAARPDGVRIEIVPLTEGVRYWPLVSSTDDETNFVTIFTAR